MAELAVRYRSPDWAIGAFLQSIIGQGVSLIDISGAALMDLKVQPINEAYAATWFFGLAHELGHLYGNEWADSKHPLFSPESASQALEICVKESCLPEDIQKQVLERAAEGDPEYTLSLQRLTSEAFADFIAVFQLFNVTRLLMYEIGASLTLRNSSWKP